MSKVNKAEERGVLMLLDNEEQVVGFVYFNKHRDRVFYRVTPMDDEDIKQLFTN